MKNLEKLLRSEMTAVKGGAGKIGCLCGVGANQNKCECTSAAAQNGTCSCTSAAGQNNEVPKECVCTNGATKKGD